LRWITWASGAGKHRTADNTDADKAKVLGHHRDGHPTPVARGESDSETGEREREREREKEEASSRVRPLSGRERA
jgi:hypothetical protein